VIATSSITVSPSHPVYQRWFNRANQIRWFANSLDSRFL